MKRAKMGLALLCLSLGISSSITAQEINWQGIAFPSGALKTINELSKAYGAGSWSEPGKRYQGKGMLLGQIADIDIEIDGDFIETVRFSWQEEGEVQGSMAYWRVLLRELLGSRVSVDLFSGMHFWQMEGGSHVRWSQELSQETRTQSAPKVTGKITSKGNTRRLYSIDREEHESEEESILEDVQIGEDQEIQVTIVHHKVEFHQVRPTPPAAEPTEGEETPTEE
jgi:hypothetical protein